MNPKIRVRSGLSEAAGQREEGFFGLIEKRQEIICWGLSVDSGHVEVLGITMNLGGGGPRQTVRGYTLPL